MPCMAFSANGIPLQIKSIHTYSLWRNGGIKALRIKDLAGKAGTSPASIYNYYGSKEK
ncbi:TetR/AcrR family transcriptional regulator [Bacillus sp. 37MA]|uniref:TetR/AcrR family transcriptional regulator n=1 Tax=Bacillaceae TaxID=186817 RepID=UPI0009E44B3B